MHSTLVLGIIAVAFIAIDHSHILPRGKHVPFAAAKRLDHGQTKRRFGFLCLFSGCVLLWIFLPHQSPWPGFSPKGIYPFLLVGWFSVSLTWSTNFRLSLRRLTTLLCLLCAAWLIPQILSPAECLRVIAWYPAISLAFGCLSLRGDVWSIRRGLGAGMHPNQRAALCAIGCLSGGGLALDGGIMEGLLLVTTNYLAVLATRSRVAFWSLNFALTVFILSAFSIMWSALMILALISAAVVLVLALLCQRGLKLLELASRLVLLGRTK